MRSAQVSSEKTALSWWQRAMIDGRAPRQMRDGRAFTTLASLQIFPIRLRNAFAGAIAKVVDSQE